MRGSKSGISPPTCVSAPLVSNRAIGEMPLRPSSSARQNASTPVPIEVTAPSPVMTTRR
jgi:hypothetical protein